MKAVNAVPQSIRGRYNDGGLARTSRATPPIPPRHLLFALAVASAACALSGCAEETGVNPAFAEATPPPQEIPRHTVGGFSVEMPAITLMPGEERTPCYLLPLEIEGPSRFVGGGRLL